MEPTQTNNASAKVVSALIIGLIVGFVAGAFWQERRLNSRETPAIEDTVTTLGETKATTSTTKEATGEKTTNGNIQSGAQTAAVSASVTGGAKLSSVVSAKDQPAGANVIVTLSDVSEPVWVAVRDYGDGTTGNILGAGKVFATGEATIPLIRPTVAGATYKAVIYKDIGDSNFDYKADVMQDGGAVFKAN
jgi:hypothetical protein